MKRVLISGLFLVAAMSLMGCETIKYTLAGPFIGFNKDMDNLSGAFNGTTDKASVTTEVSAENAASGNQQSTIQKADNWMRKNLW